MNLTPHKDPGWLVSNPVASFVLDVIPHGGMDNMGAIVGVVLRCKAYDNDGKAVGTFGERRVLQLEEVGDWVRSVMAAQRDAMASVAHEYEERKAMSLGQLVQRAAGATD